MFFVRLMQGKVYKYSTCAENDSNYAQTADVSLE
jgi:hypothetical protein